MLLGLAGITMINTAQAQFRYVFSETTATYTPLSSATSLNGSTVWDDDQFTASIPFTWKLDSVFTMTDVPVNTAMAGFLQDHTSINSATGFTVAIADFVDRGMGTSSGSLSPISYTTTGTSPNRIFKLEFENAGFFDDMTLSDYVNFQIWIYETTNVIEYHFGSSSVSTANDYFLNGAGPLSGMLQSVDIDNGSSGTIYYLDGSKSPKTIDSFDVAMASSGFPSNGLAAWPASGTVFRFSPRAAGCTKPVSTFTTAPQSALSARFTFTAPTTGLDSLVWNFGDNQRQKVTTGFGTPVNHTYSTAGRYNATVTAYNSCGSTVSSTSQVKVAVADVPGLSSVRVYPTATSSTFVVDGMSAGSTIGVYNSLGQQVLQLTVGGARQVVSLDGLASGVYQISLMEKAGGRGHAQVVKQ